MSRAAPRQSSDPRSPGTKNLEEIPSAGNTPLLPLRSTVERARGKFELWAKAEFFNPTGSVKDRAAAAIVRSALTDGRLVRGESLLDASSGNTALAYAALGKQLTFEVTLCIPRNANPERLERIRAFGANVILTDPLEGTDGAQQEARRLVAQNPTRYFYADQYNNPSNPEAHFRGTGPEIWRQIDGRVTHLVVGVGTGGTISGTARYLRSRRPSLRVIGVQPSGPLHGLEGLKHIPTARRPGTYDATLIDRTIEVDTDRALETVDQLASLEGIRVGPSSGAAVWASLEVGRAEPRSIVVTILPDGTGPVNLSGPPRGSP